MGGFGDDLANGAFEAFDGDRGLNVWRDGIPESDSARKEGVELTVHRVRDKVVGRLSGASFVYDEVLAWYHGMVASDKSSCSPPNCVMSVFTLQKILK